MSSRVLSKVHLPGVRKEDVKVEIHATHLTISAKRDSEAEQMKEVVYRRGRYDGSFFRSILLPDGMNVGDIHAEFANDVLEIRAPDSTRPPTKPKRFNVDERERASRGLRTLRPPMVEIKNILCPIDFSNHSRHALDHAVGLATWYGASVLVHHVNLLVMPALDPFRASEVVPPLTQTEPEASRATRALGEFVKEDRSAAKIETAVDESFDAADAITARAKRFNASLIVLGTNGRSGSRHGALGSVATKVLRTADRSVMNVPSRATDAPPYGPVGFRRVICPVDFSDSSKRALDFAAAIARDANALLTVVHVVELISEVAALAPDFDAHREKRLEPARQSLREAISPAVHESCAVEELLQMGTPDLEVFRLADEQKAGLIVMGARGAGGSDHARLGSTVRGIVPEARCPVLTLP